MAVLAWLPELLPDELHYSWLARVVKLNALGSPKHAVAALLGDVNVIPSIDLPTCLDRLKAVVGPLAPEFDLANLIETASLYSYHRPFLDIPRHTAVQRSMVGGRRLGLKTLIGRVANGFGGGVELRYCAKCLEEGWARHGSLYWRRAHNLPGMTICLTHRCTLSLHYMVSRGSNRHQLLLPPHCQYREDSIDDEPPWGDFDNNKHVLEFHKLSLDLLSANLPVVPPDARRVLYRTGLQMHGFVRPNGQIRWKAYTSALLAHYSHFTGFQHQARLVSPRPVTDRRNGSTSRSEYWSQPMIGVMAPVRDRRHGSSGGSASWSQ